MLRLNDNFKQSAKIALRKVRKNIMSDVVLNYNLDGQHGELTVSFYTGKGFENSHCITLKSEIECDYVSAPVNICVQLDAHDICCDFAIQDHYLSWYKNAYRNLNVTSENGYKCDLTQIIFSDKKGRRAVHCAPVSANYPLIDIG